MAEENDDIKGIILRVNSPGGGVVESAEIYDKILDIKKVKNLSMFPWDQWQLPAVIIFLHQPIRYTLAQKR